MTEMLVVLATLVPHLRLVHAQPGVPVRTELLLMLRPAGGLLMRPVERKPSAPMALTDTCLPR
jgi:hypothetical protein